MTIALDTHAAEPFVRILVDGSHSVTCAVEGIHCAACVRSIENALETADGVNLARVNATTHRLHLTWNPDASSLAPLLTRVERLGYRAVPCDSVALTADHQRAGRLLLQSLAIAGFGAMNVMVISVAVWAGLAEDMGPATRGFLHWIAAAIAIPTVVMAGYPFYRSAWTAISTRTSNMDVPISLAVLVTTAASLFQTIRGAEHVYFDAALALLFFLLIGRYLDATLRGRALSASQNLLALRGKTAHIIRNDGSIEEVEVGSIATGDLLHVAPGQRFQVDGRITEGKSTVDVSLITGEAIPHTVEPGNQVFAGSTNLDAAVVVKAGAVGTDTVLAEISALMENAEQHRGRYVSLADRMARYYTPFVFGFAVVGFLLWYGPLGAGWYDALMVAVAVLIVTCPCALGLAVPSVQVGAVARLFREGILVKSGDALERLNAVDTFVFDKTGTLTLGRPTLANTSDVIPEVALTAASMAANSNHPLARALAQEFPAAPLCDTSEIPGEGLRYSDSRGEFRLGRATFAELKREPSTAAGPELWFSGPGFDPVRLCFTDRLRCDTAASIGELRKGGWDVEILSGDHEAVVSEVAKLTEIATWSGGARPADKVTRLEELAKQGHRVAMVGDGLNDAPALTAAHISLSPSTASDISHNAADIVFQGDRLGPVNEAVAVAHKSMRLVRENIGLAIGYNLVAVPIALTGALTPFVASLLMSASSIIVTLNALRVRSGS